jgi:Lon protease-like protein
VTHTLSVFPLPRIVLFPGATLPLHVFEPRYRALVRDALAGNRSFAIALLKSGYEKDYDGNPEIHSIGCEGRIEEVVPLPDGRFLLSLTGTSRVEFVRMTRDAPYRSYQVRYLSDPTPDEAQPETQETLLRLLSAYQQILGAVSGRGAGMPLPTDLPFTITVNRIAFGLDIDPVLKYKLLETSDILGRARMVVDLLEEALPGFLDLGEDELN